MANPFRRHVGAYPKESVRTGQPQFPPGQVAAADAFAAVGISRLPRSFACDRLTKPRGELSDRALRSCLRLERSAPPMGRLLGGDWAVLVWLRPFIGQIGEPTTFFRSEAWGNAYVKMVELVLDVLRLR